MIVTVLLLLLFAYMFIPKPTSRLLEGIMSLIGKFLYPFTIGLFKAILFILKGTFQLLWELLQWFARGATRMFDTLGRRS